jgi:hypothetical protein
MRFLPTLCFLVCANSVCAQPVDTPNEAPEVTRAKSNIEALRGLVAAGAAPRAQLEKAEAALLDAGDAALLRRTVYGTELTEDQTGDMLAAANRRVERRQKAFDDAQALVDAGVAARASLTALTGDLEGARKEYTLAESRAEVIRQIAELARAEAVLEAAVTPVPEDGLVLSSRYDGDGSWTPALVGKVERQFEKQFGKPLPVSAAGDTALHRALGFDHRGRVDVAVNPDQPEGRWLLSYLVENHIPYFAFRHAVPGKATGAHIHIGPQSTRLPGV